MTTNEMAIIAVCILLIFASTITIGSCIIVGLKIKREIEAEKRKANIKKTVKEQPGVFWIDKKELEKKMATMPSDDEAEAREYQLSGIYGIKMKEAFAKLLAQSEIHEWRVPGYPEIIIREDEEEQHD